MSSLLPCVPCWMSHLRGGARNLPTEGLELPTGGRAKRTEKCSFRMSFYQIFSDENPKFRPTEGLDAFDGRL